MKIHPDRVNKTLGFSYNIKAVRSRTSKHAVKFTSQVLSQQNNGLRSNHYSSIVSISSQDIDMFIQEFGYLLEGGVLCPLSEFVFCLRTPFSLKDKM